MTAPECSACWAEAVRLARDNPASVHHVYRLLLTAHDRRADAGQEDETHA